MEEKQWCIYKHTNKVNGKVYIGQTCQELNERWNNGYGYIGCTHMKRAIEKYGWDSFEHEVLLTGLTKKEADFYESEYIEEYNAMNPDIGYNLKSGGSVCEYSEESKQRMSESKMGDKNPMWGHKQSENTRRKIGDAQRGELNHNWGKKASEELKEKMRVSHCKYMVKCIETGKLYYGAREAAKDVGLKSASGIIRCCNHKKLKTSGGYHWEYVSLDSNEDEMIGGI